MILVFVARARHYKSLKTAATDEPEVSARDVLEAYISPIIMVSFILPVLHIGLDQFGLLQESMRTAQSMVVQGSLVIIWILDIVQNLSLRVASQKAKQHSEQLEALRLKQTVAERTEKIKR